MITDRKKWMRKIGVDDHTFVVDEDDDKTEANRRSCVCVCVCVEIK